MFVLLATESWGGYKRTLQKKLEGNFPEKRATLKSFFHLAYNLPVEDDFELP